MFDLLWELESLARKFGVEDKAVFARLRKRICAFSSERTALANGVNGKRFYLMQDSQALRRHDETHIFQVGFDGEALVGELDEALALLADEAGGGDEYGNVYSPGWPDRGSTNREEDPFPKWLGVGLLVLTVCLGISLIVHVIFRGGLYCKRFF